ncbi:MAG: glutathione peroxidase, partial [Flavobacteriales bacterium]|nr:glutathione peroxidase [Flavobacteriales bacterium]
FPMMSKVHTKGDGQHAVYHWLTSKDQNGVLDSEVKWNFHKYLVDENGRLVMSLGSAISPLDKEIIEWVEQ